MKLFFYTLCILSVIARAENYTNFIPAVSSAGTYNTQNDVNGREYKAQNSKDTGNKGSAAAAAAGAAMISTAIPMIVSPILPVKIAGYDLLAKGIQELAQSGADKNSANQNGAQESLLRQNADGPNSGIFENAPNVNNALNNPELQQALQSQGIDPNSFLNRLKNNDFNNGAEIYQAYQGESPDPSESDISQGLALANQTASNAIQDANAGSGGAGADASLHNTTRTALTQNDMDESVGKNEAKGNTKGQAQRKLASAQPSTGNATANGSSSVDLKQSILNSFQGPQQNMENKDLAGVPKERFLAMGVQAPNQKQNIFHVAHRQFRNFRKWSKEDRN